MRYEKISHSAQICIHILDDRCNLPWWWCFPLRCPNHCGIVSFNKESREPCVSWFFYSIPQCSCIHYEDTGLSIMRCFCLDEFTCPVPYDESSYRRLCEKEPSKLILMNLGEGAFHLTIRFEVERLWMDPWEEISLGMQVWILHSTHEHFARISVLKGPKILCWKTATFLSFHMFHSKNITLTISSLLQLCLHLIISSFEHYSPSCIPGSCSHLCCKANLHTRLMEGHSQKRWSFDSMLFIHKGHVGSMSIPRCTRTPRIGSALWSICHKKILIFGVTSSCQIHLNGQAWSLWLKLSWEAHATERVINFSNPASPLQ